MLTNYSDEPALIGVWQGNKFNLPIFPWLDVILAFPVAFCFVSVS